MPPPPDAAVGFGAATGTPAQPGAPATPPAPNFAATPMPPKADLQQPTGGNSLATGANRPAAPERIIPVIQPNPVTPPASPVVEAPVLGRPLPAFAPPAVASSPPTAVLATSVDSYDVEVYRCQSADSFRGISKAYYGSEKYERALLMYNRENSPNGTDFRQDQPLRAGQTISIPPLRILTKEYGNVISVPPTSTEAPRPPDNGQPRSAATTTGTATQRAYRVGDKGQTFWEIARKTLNDSGRWTDIYSRNKNHDPLLPIPAGEILYLPPDARVDSSDVPSRPAGG
jgi:nucleoid-associated protein YgaU